MILSKIPPHIIALDLDGTLLTDDKTVDSITKRYLRKLEKLGHIIVIATGRPQRAIFRYYEDIGLHSPFICYNGACVTSPHDQSFANRHFAFPKDVVKDIYNFVGRSHIENVMCETNRNIWLLDEDEDLADFFWHENMNIIYGDLNETLDEDPMTMIIKSVQRTDEDDQRLIDAVKRHEHLQIRFWSRSQFSEIYYDYISKGHALLDIAVFYKIPKERVLAFGDAENDIEMLTMAGVGFGMQNGVDHIKRTATYVTEFSNNEEGIYHALRRYFRNYRG